MKSAIAIVLSVAVLVIVGCQSPKGGGMSEDETFTVVTPPLAMKATQGETKELNVSVNRGKYFKQDVTLQIKASEGISVQPTQVTVRASERPQVHLRVEVPNKAALGDYKIYIKAMPETGEATSSEYNVKVVAPGS